MDEFFLSPSARDDVFDLWEFIAQRDVDAADRVEKELYRAMRLLARTPGLGHLRTDLADEPLRFWRVFKFLIIYRAETQPLEIVRVLRGTRDIKSVLEKS